MNVSIGISGFAKKNSCEGTGNSFSTLPDHELIQLTQDHWRERIPGNGEGNSLDRKVLVPINPIITKDGKPCFFCAPRMLLQKNMPIRAKVVSRQEGEDLYVETFIETNDAIALGFQYTPATNINIVCYSAEALLENGGTRSTDCDFEIVTILCSNGEQETMSSLTMARNMLEMPGGTKGEYSAMEFAQAIYKNSRTGVKVKSF